MPFYKHLSTEKNVNLMFALTKNLELQPDEKTKDIEFGKQWAKYNYSPSNKFLRALVYPFSLLLENWYN